MSEQVCAKCGGTGYLTVERDGLSGAERCSCYEARRTAQRERKSGIPPKFLDRTLVNFNTAGGLSAPFLQVRGYAEKFPLVEPPGLLLIGPTGTGKTHLAAGALRRIMAKGFDGIFFDYQTLLERIQRSWGDSSDAGDKDAYRQALDTDVLLLDDLGARRSLEWVEDTVTAIITHRYNEKKPLIATTNLPDPVFGKVADASKTLAEVIGERARSRLFEMCRVVEMPPVEDYRVRTSTRIASRTEP